MKDTISLYDKPSRKFLYGNEFNCQPEIQITEENTKLVISPSTRLFWSKKEQNDLVILFRISEILMQTEEDIGRIDFSILYTYLLSLSMNDDLGISESEINLESIIDKETLIEIMKKPIPEEIKEKLNL